MVKNNFLSVFGLWNSVNFEPWSCDCAVLNTSNIPAILNLFELPGYDRSLSDVSG